MKKPSPTVFKLRIIIGLIASGSLLGCQSKPPPAPVKTGPTDAQDEAVSKCMDSKRKLFAEQLKVKQAACYAGSSLYRETCLQSVGRDFLSESEELRSCQREAGIR